MARVALGYFLRKKRRVLAISTNDVASWTIQLKDVVQELMAHGEWLAGTQ